MRRLLRFRPSPALVIACVALFVSLGGVSYGIASGAITSRAIKNNTVSSKDIKNLTITAKDVKKNSLGGTSIRESRLGKVPNAAHADTADTATNATNATNASNAAALGGATPASYAKVAQPSYTAPTLGAGFTNFGGGYAPAGYLKDTLGFVHLRGALSCPTGENTAFTLPVGYRPAQIEFGPLGVGGQPGGNLSVEPDGDVRPYLPGAAAPCGLGGFTFRPAP